MRVAVLCSGTVLQPTLQALASQNLLVGLGTPDNMPNICSDLEQAARQVNLPFTSVNAANIESQLSDWIKASNPDVVCVMGFPHKIPASILQSPKFGFFNFHGGALPRYRGPVPVFWQIRNQETNGAIAVHRITPELDTGDIAHIEPVPIGPEDTYGLYMQRLGAILPRVMIEFIQRLAIHGNELPLNGQVNTEANYWRRPTEADLTVDWGASADAIAALVRATNPAYSGALTTLKGIPIRLLQVTHEDKVDSTNLSPGTIIEASPERGIRVICGNGGTLFLDIIHAEDGFFTGRQLVKLFDLRMGEQMGPSKLPYSENKNTPGAANEYRPPESRTN